jgi:hypothetical protein
MFSQKVVHWWQCTYNKRPWCFKKFVFSSVGKKHDSAPAWHNITWNPMKKEKKCKMLSEGVHVVVLMKLKLYINDHVMVLKKLSLLSWLENPRLPLPLAI